LGPPATAGFFLGTAGRTIRRSQCRAFNFFLHRPSSLTQAGCVESLSTHEIERAVEVALAEDVGSGDVTTLATVPDDATATAALMAREPLILAGILFAEIAFHQLASDVRVRRFVEDGQRVERGSNVLEICGSARAILTAERVALNFVQRLSGVATLTAAFVQAIQGTHAAILDTRKTTPGWRRFEKYAVSCGGGCNHRFGLFDLVLIKDNHLAALRHEKPNAIAAAVGSARAMFPNLKIEVETDTLKQVGQAADAGADIILLDNMSPVLLREAVQFVAGRAKTEASGGVTLDTVREIAETGVDFISVGALTNSARAMDLALDFQS
jgi:nicotinate-nucleotide pyrophosphorylase (carboxylating)